MSYVTPKSIVDMCRVAKNLSHPTLFPAVVNRRHFQFFPWKELFFWGLFHPSFCALCWWFCCLQWPPSTALQCCPVFLRRLWCAFWRKHVREAFLRHEMECCWLEFNANEWIIWYIQDEEEEIHQSVCEEALKSAQVTPTVRMKLWEVANLWTHEIMTDFFTNSIFGQCRWGWKPKECSVTLHRFTPLPNRTGWLTWLAHVSKGNMA